MDQAAAFDPLLGATLGGRYAIERRIGEGGMGAVYEARHTVLGRKVAVKVLLERLAPRRELVQRLLQEARMASSIGHDHIVDVLDFGTTEDGRSFVVMEFLEGESLAALLAREAPLPVERVLRIGCQIASALGAAHDKGIVHRDLKPENVFIIQRDERDFVKVVDFGVSKAARGDEAIENLRLTRTGVLLGTPLYMSPEQARGDEDVDARADIWALGVVLYESLTGEVPFRASNYLQVIAQVLSTEITPPSRLRPELGIPPAVEAIVLRALARQRDDRPPTMAAVQRALEQQLPGAPLTAPGAGDPAPAPAPPPRGARWPLAVGATLLVAGALALALLEEGAPAPPRAAAPLTPPAVVPAPAIEAPPRVPPSVPAAPPELVSAPGTPPVAAAPAMADPPPAGRAAPGVRRGGRRAGAELAAPPGAAATEVGAEPQYRGGDQVLPTESIYDRRAPGRTR